MYNATGSVQKQDLWLIDSKLDETNKKLDKIIELLEKLTISTTTVKEKTE